MRRLIVLLATWWGVGFSPLAPGTVGTLAAGEQDPQVVVIDEVVGFLVVMIALPPKWPYLLAGFILFRIFDVIKPPPIRFVERTVQRGYGVVLDDVLAALYAHIALRILFLFLPNAL
jgi:phosphatidylglycerophosphatase A